MGVKGLWKLLEPAGKPIDPQSLEGKILGVDVSIWLYQALCGSSTPNAHLVTLMRRIAKLLYFRIKPIFVFDGSGVPQWKRRVLETRRLKKQSAKSRREDAQSKLLRARLKRALQRKATAGLNLDVASEEVIVSTSTTKDMFSLPIQPSTSAGVPVETESELSESSDSDHEEVTPKKMKLEEVQEMSPSKRREYLQDLRETVLTSAGNVLPEGAEDFSSFQISRILEAKKLSTQINAIGRVEDEVAVSQFDINFGSMYDGLSARSPLKAESTSSMYDIESFVSADGKRSFLLKDNRKKLWNKILSSSGSERVPEELVKLLQEDRKPAQSNSGMEHELSRSDVEHENDLNRDSSGGERVAAFGVTAATTGSVATPIRGDANCATTSFVSDEATNSALSESACASSANALGRRVKPTIVQNLNEISLSTKPSSSDDNSSDVEVLQNGGFLMDHEVQHSLFDSPRNAAASITDSVMNLEQPTTPTGLGSPRRSPQPMISLKTGAALDDQVSTEQQKITETTDDDFVDAGAVISERTSPSEAETGVNAEPISDSGSDSDFEPVPDIELPADVAIQYEADGEPLDWSRDFTSEIDELERLTNAADKEARNVTEDAYNDCQALLDLFAIPYMIAPGEAEAQCAYLEAAGLTNGTLTDDSDAFLFGSKTVIRHFFNQKQHCMAYRMSEVERLMGLTRVDLCRIAMLSGCDYTVGVSGVGIVKAVEIIAQLTAEDDTGVEPLEKFRESCLKPSTSDLPHPDPTAFPPSFPNPAILNYFARPDCNRDPDRPTWGQPDLEQLKRFAHDRMGWEDRRTENMLRESIERWNRKEGQQTLRKFLHTCEILSKPEGSASARLKTALKRLKHEPGSDTPGDATKPARKRVKTRRIAKTGQTEAVAVDSQAVAPTPDSISAIVNPVNAGASTSADLPVDGPSKDCASGINYGSHLDLTSPCAAPATSSVDRSRQIDRPATERPADGPARRTRRKVLTTPRERLNARFAKAIAPGAKARHKKMVERIKAQREVDLSESD